MELKEIYTEIAKAIKDFLNSNQRQMVLKTFTGSGKTTLALETSDVNGFRFIYAAPSHDIITENIEDSTRHKFTFLHLKGREKCCLHPEIKEMAAAGIDISFFCKDCGYRGEICEYERNMREIYQHQPNIALTHAHITSWLPQFLSTRIGDTTIRDLYDVLIIDENPIKCFLNEMQMTVAELSYLRDCCNTIHLSPSIIEVLNLMLASPLEYDRLRTMPFPSDKIKIMQKFSKRIGELYRTNQISEPPKNALSFLFEIMENRSQLEHMIYYREGKINLSYFKPNALNLGIKILALDGTASIPVWHQMLGGEPNILSIDYQYKNVFQLNAARYPITSWKKGNKVATKLCKLIDRIAKRKTRNVLVVATKDVIRKISKISKAKNKEYAVYYNLRSKNSYWKKCDTVILALEPNPPQEKIISCVALSEWPESVWRLIFREEEMRQAIGRIRQNLLETPDGEKRQLPEVYIFPSTGVIKGKRYSDLLPEARVISLENLSDMLDIDGFYNEENEMEIIILRECPTNMKSIEQKYKINHYKALRYFLYLEREGFMVNEDGKYEITDRGIKRLPLKDQASRGTINRTYAE